MGWLDLEANYIPSFKQYDTMGSYQVLEAAKQENYLAKLASFDLMLLPLAGSEASVERGLWGQKIISPPERSSNSEITELDRVMLTEDQYWLIINKS